MDRDAERGRAKIIEEEIRQGKAELTGREVVREVEKVERRDTEVSAREMWR